MLDSCTTRPVRADDAAVIAGHRYYRGEPQADRDAYATWLASRVGLGTYLGFVAVSSERVVAGAGVVLLDWGPTMGEAGGTRGRIANVYCEPEWRRRGLARQLVEQTLAACRQQGIRVFNLAASAEAEPLYRALGFVDYRNEMIFRPR